MAESLLGQALVALFHHLVPRSHDFKEPSIHQLPELPPVFNAAEFLSSVWGRPFTNLFNSPPTPPIVLFGDHSPSLVTLIELAHQLSPEVLLVLILCGIVFLLMFISYVILSIFRKIVRTVRRYLFGYDLSHQADFAQLSDAARQVYALVQLQTPGLFAQSPVPILTPRRNRHTNTHRRR